MDSAKSQLIDRLKSANTVLVTVSRNPSVDQLAACIGLTLLVNKLGKHGSAVYSGETPSTLEFLKPENTIEKNTDSLRDFIIALDKDKADKLRYKVEDQSVRIFITPYKTSLSEADLEFSQGDFNVELIIALGVEAQDDLDQAITAHGRILHDATVASVNIANKSTLGSINWSDPQASSLCEIVTDLAKDLGQGLIDQQIATSLLTGIVSETERFSNEKTSALTMTASAQLMAAGANQQLVATELASKEEIVQTQSAKIDEEYDSEADVIDDVGTLNIAHKEKPKEEQEDIELPSTENEQPEDHLAETSLPAPTEMPETEDVDNEVEAQAEVLSSEDEPVNENEQKPEFTDQGEVDDHQKEVVAGENKEVESEIENPANTRFVSEPPRMGGVLTANSTPESYDPSIDPISNVIMPSEEETVSTKAPTLNPISNEENEKSTMPAGFTPPPPAWVPPFEDKQLTQSEEIDTEQEPGSTISDLEKRVNSPHVQNTDVDDARSQVEAVLAQTHDEVLPPTESLNAMPLGEPLHETPAEELSSEPVGNSSTAQSPVINNQEPIQNTTGLDPSLFSEPPKDEENLIPPVPPPIPVPYNFGQTNPGEHQSTQPPAGS